MSVALLELRQIDKSYFGVRVLKRVSLQLRRGSTLGLVGENGAGKSTLMNILGGNVQADSGEMLLSGKPYLPHSPRQAEASGIAFIHQELNLFPNLSIAENLFLTSFPRRFGAIDRRALHRRAGNVLRQVGLDVPPSERVENLSAGERQLVEIGRALSRDPALVILDEPTTSLTARERERLLELLRSLQARGISMIYISHALGDVARLCDELAILRDGEVVGNGPMNAFPLARMVTLMVGREMDQQFPPRSTSPRGTTLLAVRSVSQPGMVRNISFALHQGEILGIAGLMGSGRTELARILFGLDPIRSGAIELCGRPIDRLTTRQRIQRGLALLTESRRDDGLCMTAPIADNLALVAAPRYAQRWTGLLAAKSLARAVAAMRQSVRLTATADLRRPVQTLSGGNQQKVVLAKWLLNSPQVLILDEPTRGIDVGARYEIYRLIVQLAQSGAGVLMISSEIEELIGLCDRILVMSEGEVQDELPRAEFNPERMLRAALRSDHRRGGEA